MKRIYRLGKIAYYSNRKANALELELELRNTDFGPEFSVCGSVWNIRHTDILAGGQCLDDTEILKKVGATGNSKLYHEVLDLWKKYHLNSMNAGTKAQMAALDEGRAKGKLVGYDYTDECNYLKSVGLLEVPVTDELKKLVKLSDGQETYKFGTGWVYNPIPEADMNRIKNVMSLEPNPELFA